MSGKSTKEITRDYFDSLMLEMRLIDSAAPDTGLKLYGQRFETPVMTAALSHLGTFNPEMPDGMIQYALGATAVSVGGHLIPYIRKGGEEAVARRIREMTEELRGAMAYTGVKNLSEFDASVLHRV